MLYTQSETAEIRKWIQDKMPDMVEDLKRICRIPSVAQVKGAEVKPYGQACIDVLEEMLLLGEENGFQIHNYDNYVGRITYAGKSEKNIGIWAHLDVVEEGNDWDYFPFDPIVKDGYFIARGCQDNKSSAIIALYALKYMKEHNILPQHTMEIYLGTCEEQGMYDIDYFLEHYQAPALSLVPDSGFPVCIGERGSFNGELTCSQPCSIEGLEIDCHCDSYTVSGKVTLSVPFTEEVWEKCKPEKKASHAENEVGVWTEKVDNKIFITAKGISTQAAHPQKGKNALSMMAAYVCERELFGKVEQSTFEFIKEINQDYQGTALQVHCEDELSGSISLVATRLRLSEGYFVIDFISKYPVTQNDFPFEALAAKAAYEKGFTLKTTRLAKANYFDPNRPQVQILTRVSNEVLGREDAPFIMSGGTYASKLPHAFAFGTGMPLPPRPVEIFRPGHGDYHQPDESISLERMRKGLEIYIKGLLQIDF